MMSLAGVPVNWCCNCVWWTTECHFGYCPSGDLFHTNPGAVAIEYTPPQHILNSNLATCHLSITDSQMFNYFEIGQSMTVTRTISQLSNILRASCRVTRFQSWVLEEKRDNLYCNNPHAPTQMLRRCLVFASSRTPFNYNRHSKYYKRPS